MKLNTKKKKEKKKYLQAVTLYFTNYQVMMSGRINIPNRTEYTRTHTHTHTELFMYNYVLNGGEMKVTQELNFNEIIQQFLLLVFIFFMASVFGFKI